MKTLVEKFPTSPVTWDTLDREELGVEEFRGYVEKYYEGLEVCKEMFGMAFSTLTDLAEVFPNIIVRFVKKIIKLL